MDLGMLASATNLAHRYESGIDLLILLNKRVSQNS